MIRRILAAALLALTFAGGCVYQDPVQEDFVNDLQGDFENEDYFNP